MLDMTDPKFNRFGNVDTLEELIPLIKRNHIIPFIGAGMSFDIYDSLGAALKHMMEGHFKGRKDEAEEVNKIIRDGDFEVAAQKINDGLRNIPFQDRLVAIFKESLITDEHLKKIPVRYLPRIFKDSLVVTTNFDKMLEWLVLDVQQDKALLIAKDCLLKASYNEQLKDITWVECTLWNKVLPDIIKQIFNDAERGRVLQYKNKNPDNARWKTPGGADTDDDLFLLSIDEVKNTSRMIMRAS